MPPKRARWTLSLEKGFIDILSKLNVPIYRGRKGWTKSGWDKIVEVFNRRYTIGFSKNQLRQYEAVMKRDYRLIKEARLKEGVTWDHEQCMIVATDEVWQSLIDANPYMKKWRSKSIPNYDALDSLYKEKPDILKGYTIDENTEMGLDYGDDSDGGESTDDDVLATACVDVDVLKPGLPESLPEPDEPSSILQEIQPEPLPQQGAASLRPHVNGVASGTTTLHKETKVRKCSKAASNNSAETTQPKRTKTRPHNLAGVARPVMVRLQASWDSTVDAEDESCALPLTAMLNHLRSAASSGEFSIPKCIRVLNEMDLSAEEKARAANLFIEPYNREIFLSSAEDVRSVWIKLQIGKQPSFGMKSSIL